MADERDDLDLSNVPPIYILTEKINPDSISRLTTDITSRGGSIVINIADADIILTAFSSKKRAEFEIERLKSVTSSAKRPLAASEETQGVKRQKEDENTSSRKVVSSNSPSKQLLVPTSAKHKSLDAHQQHLAPPEVVTSEVQVVKVQWINDCLEQDQLLSRTGYVIFQYPVSRQVKAVEVLEPGLLPTSHIISKRNAIADHVDQSADLGLETEIESNTSIVSEAEDFDPNGTDTEDLIQTVEQKPLRAPNKSQAILNRAFADAQNTKSKTSGYRDKWRRYRKSDFMRKDTSSPLELESHQMKVASLQRTTSSLEDEEDISLPDPPLWITQRKKYACERPTPSLPYNKSFIDLLKKVRQVRLLLGDQIGVRAYSTSIAALSAYPYKIQSRKEVIRLPGCDSKIAYLFELWKHTGHVPEADLLETDENIKILNRFYDIWGVGDKTARDFLNKHGWHDLDDVVEAGWDTLNRVQKIGLKYYDDFLIKLSRTEVEHIAGIIHGEACQLRPGVQSCIVGGYRRGNAESGDVDIVITHKEPEQTSHFIEALVQRLEETGYVTHTLKMTTTNSKRGQEPLPLRVVNKVASGFDTLDKALLVWRDKVVPSLRSDDPNLDDSLDQVELPPLRRRVDIIIAPWKTVGCALIGWSGGTTFQRDIRRYTRKEKGYRFDSSGIRNLSTGHVVELEGPNGVAGSMIDAEKAVFQGLGLEYREPWERCTG
jgi:DNA polymerase IV